MKKKLIPIISGLVCAIACTFGLVACSGGDDTDKPSDAHKHSYQWVDNGDGTHKQHCSVAGCDEPDINVESHVWGSDNKCEKCKAVKPEVDPPAHSHVWSQGWESNDTHHWHNCTADGCTITANSQKDSYGEHDFSNGNCICGKEKPAVQHSHVWSQSWESNDTHHWHNCTASGCTITDNSQKDGYGEHDFSSGNCVCGKQAV